MQIQLIRHATLRVTMGGRTLLVDPMLSDKEAMDPVANASNDRRIPLVPLPFSPAEILKDVQAVLVTHTHRDHWDDAATAAIPKSMPILCQPPDEKKFQQFGYTDVRAIAAVMDFEDLQITRTDGQHGTGEIGRQMAPVSGFVIRTDNEPALYIAGDTIFCPEVEMALGRYQPQVVVVNAGAAQFKTGGPITMNSLDVAKTAKMAPAARIIAVHMDTINHCLLTREMLEREMKNFHLQERIAIPQDGETLELR